MFVNKYKIAKNIITGDTFQLPITISRHQDLVGQTDLIKTEFVEIEKAKVINDIEDYEKVRFSPCARFNQLMNSVTYKLHFYDGSTFTNETWDSIGFTYEDIYYRKSRFKKSFLELVFYDSDNLLAQNPIFVVTLFPQITPYETITSGSEIKFDRKNPITNPKGFAEGYYMYFYKDLVEIGENYDLYMRATFFNASTGIAKPLMVNSSVPQYDETFTDKIHLKYTFKKTSEDYLYMIQNTSVVDYDFTNKKITVDLYESVTL